MKTSPARRVHDFLQRALQVPLQPSTTGLMAWALVFGVRSQENLKSPPIAEDEVTGLLRFLRAEIEEVRKRLVIDEESRLLVAPMVKRALNVTSVSLLASDWSSARQTYLTNDLMTAWAWAARTLPATEDVPDPNDVKDLMASLTELQEVAKLEGVPAALRAFVLHQVRDISEAVARVEISGTRPLSEAVDRGIGEIVRASEQYQAAASDAPKESSKLWAKVSETWTRAAKVAGQLDQLRKGLTVLSDAYAKVSGFLPFMRGGDG